MGRFPLPPSNHYKFFNNLSGHVADLVGFLPNFPHLSGITTTNVQLPTDSHGVMYSSGYTVLCCQKKCQMSNVCL